MIIKNNHHLNIKKPVELVKEEKVNKQKPIDKKIISYFDNEEEVKEENKENEEF